MEPKTVDVIISVLEQTHKSLEAIRAQITRLDGEVNKIKVEVWRLKDHEIMKATPEELQRLKDISPNEIKKMRVRDYATGTSIGGAVVALIDFIRQYF